MLYVTVAMLIAGVVVSSLILKYKEVELRTSVEHYSAEIPITKYLGLDLVYDIHKHLTFIGTDYFELSIDGISVCAEKSGHKINTYRLLLKSYEDSHRIFAISGVCKLLYKEDQYFCIYRIYNDEIIKLIAKVFRIVSIVSLILILALAALDKLS